VFLRQEVSMNPSSVIAQYPLSESAPDRLKTPSGLVLKEITLDAVLEGRVQMQDLRVTPEALELQAQISEAAGRIQLAENLRRAAELAGVPEEKILQIYTALRPGRSSQEVLQGLAAELENNWQAPRCARFLREAAKAYFK
jgi:propanediol dehydratase small subunit